MNITLDEFKARYFSPEERAKREAERIKAEKERVRKVKAAEREYWAYRRQINSMNLRYMGPMQKKGVVS